MRREFTCASYGHCPREKSVRGGGGGGFGCVACCVDGMMICSAASFSPVLVGDHHVGCGPVVGKPLIGGAAGLAVYAASARQGAPYALTSYVLS